MTPGADFDGGLAIDVQSATDVSRLTPAEAAVVTSIAPMRVDERVQRGPRRFLILRIGASDVTIAADIGLRRWAKDERPWPTAVAR